MNRRDQDVLLALAGLAAPTQRTLAKACGCSLGAINASVQALQSEGYLRRDMALTDKSHTLLSQCAPRRAILLAAGFGLQSSRTLGQLPKALLEVRSQRLIDRIIDQLREAGVTEIYAVVGFAKEQFEYLLDRGIKLIVNPLYAEKHNLHSLFLARAHLDNCYIVPCDLWCAENPFRRRELYSWYMVSQAQSIESSVRVNRNQELITVPYGKTGNEMIGISYLTGGDAALVASRLEAMAPDRRCKGYFWEETLYEGAKLSIGPRLVAANGVTEINSPSDLTELNTRSADLALAEICRLLPAAPEDIRELTLLKRGMTNTTFRFLHEGQPCIVRIPTGQSSIRLCRRREGQVYRALEGRGICEDVLCFEEATGVKLSRFLKDVRPCDPQNHQDVARCMTLLRSFHQANIQTAHTFDLFGEMEYYEALWEGAPSLYPDYAQTKSRILSLRPFIESQERALCLTHLDAVPENFLLPPKGAPRLIDWEHAAMADPHLDIAMFCLQALYHRRQVDETIDAYFPEGCPRALRLKIYCYMAAGGLLWSNWCEHEIRRGAEFGAYSLMQYRYAKEYCKLVQEELNLIKGESL